jgi:hypothetical protein
MSDAPKPGSPGDGAARPDEAPDEFLAEPPAPESRWLLLALSRHVERQRWVARVGAERLGADIAQIGRAGAFGHPERQRGAVPGLPDWTFYFHGIGLCLTREDGLKIDVDFIDGRDDVVDPWLFQRYLKTEPEPGLPERRLQRPAPFDRAWMCDLHALEARGWIALERGARLTPAGEAEAGRLAAAAAAIEGAQTPGAAAQQAARFGDLELALESMSPGPARALLEQRRAEQRRERRDWLLTLDRDDHRVVSALGALGRELSEEAVLGAMRQTPPKGAASIALEVVTAWGASELAPEVLDLLTRAEGTAPPAPSLRIRCARLLLRWYGPEDLPASTRATLLEVLERDFQSYEGEVGLAIALLDRPRGLRRLALTADSGSDGARQKASCALALLSLLGVAEAGPLLSAARSDEARAALAVLEDRPLPMAPEPVGEQRVAGWTRRLSSLEELRRAEVPGAVLHYLEVLLRDYRDILQRWL